MGAEIIQLLIDTTLAASIAVMLIGLLRKPMRAAVGARAAYALWFLVPAMTVAVLLPATPPILLSTRTTLLPDQVGSALTALTAGESASDRALLIYLALAIWSVGTTTMFFSMLRRHRLFIRMLGVLMPDEHGLYRCNVAAPMLVGTWRSKIVVPTDFDVRYSLVERELILAHERAHESRRDIVVNAVASLALCLCWFNPLMYRALVWLRTDQELACDALVLSSRGGVRRSYARALLKTQLATESAWGPPTGCHWQSTHPLKERIYMLNRPLPGRPRRLAGLGFISALTVIASYAAWAGQPAMERNPSILIDLKTTISNPETHEVKAMMTQYLVHSGETPKGANGRPLDFACTPYLADEPGRSTDWSDQKARGIPLPVSGQILLDCTIRRDGEVLKKPAVITKDGKLATIETVASDNYRYRFEITPSTSPERIAAAKKQTLR
ncbi:MAG TPA: M56 family metallopeptidase [Steroidobacteraceae bacterium]